MIANVELANIRVFEGQGWKFPFAKLSVLCGTNSAGKSTVLKSLLLLIQSHDPRNPTDRIGQLKPVGPLVDFGNFKSLVSHRDSSRDITIAIEMSDSVENRHLRQLRKVRRKTPTVDPDEYIEYSLKASFRFGVLECRAGGDSNSPPLPFDGDLPNARGWTNEAYLKETAYELRTQDGLSLDWTVSIRSKSIGKQEIPDYEILLPGDYFGAVNGFTVMDVPRVSQDSYVRVECLLRGLLPGGLWVKPRRPSGGDGEREETFFPLPRLIQEVCRDLTNELQEVHYIGPMRSPAKRYYVTSGSMPLMDAAGDFLPYVLRDRSESEVIYVPPGASTDVLVAPLKIAIDVWLYYLRTGQVPNLASSGVTEIDTSYIKDVLLEFTLRSFGDESHALADSGFGYSQILPIVVRGLIAADDDTIMIEQPEVHLNPALQVRVAEFLISLVRSGKNVIVETHSEHIVNAFRVLAAEDEKGELAKDYVILFLDTDEGVPGLRHFEVLSDGTIPDWPRAFMGEAMKLTSRLLKAQERRLGSTRDAK